MKDTDTALPLKKINQTLLALIIAVNLYTIITPFAPAVVFWLKQHFSSAGKSLGTLVSSPGVHTGEVPAPAGQRLIIPSILLDQPIVEGNDPLTVHRGVWRRPASSTPAKGGNTVLTGHRFTYKGASVFYELDKVEVGQRLAVFWDNNRYVYEVTDKKTVPPQQTDIEAPTKDTRLTIYTCTPLWTAKNRLVIIAKPVEGA